MTQVQAQRRSGIAGGWDRAFNRAGSAIEWLSLEVILTKVRRANGGDVILIRSFLVASWICILLLLLGLVLPIDSPGLANFGAILAVVYAALYARFSQQWHYLANLYNTIKTAEVRTATQEQKRGLQNRLAQLKAGFIEDADTLHLANKPMISSIICAWAADTLVAHWFNEYTNGGRVRFEHIITEAQATCEREKAKWPSSNGAKAAQQPAA